MVVNCENSTLFSALDNAEVESVCGTDEAILGTVVSYTPQVGLVVEFSAGVRGFLSLDKFEDAVTTSEVSLVSKVGKVVLVKVETYDFSKKMYILNRKSVQQAYKKDVLSTMKPGTVLQTVITSVAPFGVFVDVGAGVLGLLPVADVSVARFDRLPEAFKVGKGITVVYRGCVNGKYFVSHKELLGTWAENVSNFSTGEVVHGVVREIKDYGVFIEISPNLSGLADFNTNLDIHVGDSVSVLIKSTSAEKLKVKLHIVEVSDIPFIPQYNYYISDGVISEWCYTPKESMKLIKTVFDGSISTRQPKAAVTAKK